MEPYCKNSQLSNADADILCCFIASNIESLANTSTKNYFVCYITLILFESCDKPIV